MRDNMLFCKELGKYVEFTSHAAQRLVERDIPYSQVLTVLKHGNQQNGTERVTYRDVTVVAKCSADSILVITAFWKDSNAA